VKRPATPGGRGGASSPAAPARSYGPARGPRYGSRHGGLDRLGEREAGLQRAPHRARLGDAAQPRDAVRGPVGEAIADAGGLALCEQVCGGLRQQLDALLPDAGGSAGGG